MSGTSINWDRPDLLRTVADMNGDKRADIVGFAPDRVWTAEGLGDGSFSSPAPVVSGFGFDTGWRANKHVRYATDLNGDGRADILGFGDDGVWVALNNGDGTFAEPHYVLAEFGFNQGWRVELHPRVLADLTGDGRPDIVGFGDAGVWVALNKGDGTFAPPRFVLGEFGVKQGWRVEMHPRFLGDLTGDGRADIVGFGNDGVWTALGNGDGTFAAARFVSPDFGYNQGWRVDKHARFLADLNGDHRADMVGFGDDGIWTALSNGNGTFAAARFVSPDFGYNQGWRPDLHPRLMADIAGQGRADIIGFGDDGVWTAIGTGDGGFARAQFVLAAFNVKQGWSVDEHPRYAADLNGDGRADIVGFGDDGIWTALGNGDGSFAAAQFVLADFGQKSGIKHRTIPLAYLQKKFDVLFNDRGRPLFQVRLDNPDGTFGKSTATIAVDAPAWDDPNGRYDFAHPRFAQDLHDLNFSVLGITYNYFFQNLNSDRLTLKVVGGNPLAFELVVHFETVGIEMKVDGHTGHDIDFDGFNIKLKLELTVRNGKLEPFGFVEEIESAIKRAPILVASALKDSLIKSFIDTDASVNVPGWPDGTVANDVEKQFNSRIYSALVLDETTGKNPFRDSLGELLTTWMVGGKFDVLGVSSDGQNLKIDYVVGPGQLDPLPETRQAPLEPGLLSNIDHIVVLMMENRSFDHMLGYLSLDPSAGGHNRADIDGHRSGTPFTNPFNGQDYPSFRIDDPQFVHETPPHEYDLVEGQINGGGMDGFVREFAAEYQLSGDDARAVMAHYDGATLQAYDWLAAHFLVCDRWFAAHPGPTFCNRFYLLTGRLNRDSFGRSERNNFAGANFKPVFTKTVFDHLSERAVSWRFYEQRYCTLRLYDKYVYDTDNIVDFDDPVTGFERAAAMGTLPSVSFIDPNFVDEPDAQDNDDAAPGNVRAGQALIARIVQALMNGPKWQKTLFVITYDEHGGFFDHVNPLDPQFRVTAAPVSGIDHYGVRVPAIVVSPWVGRGSSSKVVFDHTSIIKTIARRFMSANPPDMGERVAAANDLSAVLQSTAQPDRPIVPTVAPPERKAVATPEHIAVGAPEHMAIAAPEHIAVARRVADPMSTDFKDVMQTLRARFPVRSPDHRATPQPSAHAVSSGPTDTAQVTARPAGPVPA